MLRVIFTFCLLSISTLGAAQGLYKEGRDYIEIAKPVQTVDATKVEVTEVFWYGCPHCNQFRPIFDSWKKKQAKDVIVQHSPAIWNKNMIVHANIFYTAKVLGKSDEMHEDIFDAMHKQRKRMLDEKEIYSSVFKKHGISEEEFKKTFKSFGVLNMVTQAEKRARNEYKVQGTPEVVVNGRYRISTRQTGTHQKMLQVAEYLIDKERKRMGIN